MNVLVAGVAFWVLTIVVLARLLVIGRGAREVTAARALFWVVALAAAFLLYFRPHEDILGGQDGGAYLNFGARFARQPHLSWQDPLLSEVPPETREQFLLYGNGRPYFSKFACGRIKDFDRSIVTVWFQPACPIVMGIAARLGSPKLVLFVIPFFALLTAFSLRAVAARILPGRWAGNIVFCLYLLNPIVLWHGRAPRPEFIASFLLFAGAALLLNAWQAARWQKWPDLVLGSACLGLAPFFHITAAMLVLPAALMIAAAILSGRDDFFLFPAVAAAALAGFAWQTLSIADTYSLRRFVVAGLEHGLSLTLFLVCLLTLLAAGCFIARRRKRNPPGGGNARAGWVIAAAVVAVYAACFLIARQTPPSRENPFTAYFYRTDFVAVLNMISRPLGILGLAGLAVLAGLPGSSRRERQAILLFGVPATLMIGNLYDFFMTRYTAVALLPMLALGLAALVSWFPADRRRQQAAALACAAGIALLGLHGRTQLARTVVNEGLTDFLQSFADPVRQDNGILLFEYSRIAAPFEHMFGVPTLGIPNERHDDYSQMEKAWETIMRNHPNRPAYFATPFQPPFSTTFDFVPVAERSYSGRRLVSRLWDLPTETAEWRCHLSMYRIVPRAADESAAYPDTRPLGAGNMGLKKFGNVVECPWQIEGIALDADTPVTIPVPSAGELFLFLQSDAPLSEVRAGGKQTVAIQPVHLIQDWWLARVTNSADRITIASAQPAFLADCVLVGRGTSYSLIQDANLPGKTVRTIRPFPARWARQDSAFCLRGGRHAMIFLAGPSEVGERTTLILKPGAKPVNIPTGKWMWCVWPLRKHDDRSWLKLETAGTLNPPTDFPEDLVALMGYISVAK